MTSEKKNLEPPHVVIQGSEVERVLLYKYLGLIFDYLLNWKNNTDAIIKKANQRLYCLKRLAHFNVKESLLQRFYSSFVESSLTFGVTAWGGNVTQNDRQGDFKVREVGWAKTRQFRNDT